MKSERRDDASRESEGTRGDREFGTIPRLVRIARERHAARSAIEDGETTLTYAALAEEVERASRALIALGVEKGDRVAVWAPNLWEWIVAALGAHAAGGVVVPINTRFKGNEAGYVLAKSAARVLFTVSGFLGNDYVTMLRASDVAVPALEHIVLLRGAGCEGATTWSDFMRRGEAVSAAQATARADSVAPHDLSDLIFTSGTTGHPKGVMCTHAQSLRAFRDWSDTVGLREGDRYLIVLPFFHTFGYKAGWLASLMMGATILPQPVFDVGEVLARVGKDRVTVLPGSPALYQSFLARPDLKSFDLSTLRLAVTGAAVIPVELIHRMRRELHIETVVTGYGLTEGTGVSTMCRVGDDPETIATTSGRAIPGVEVRVVDDAGHEVARGEPGEVVVRGYTVMQGYFGDPAETAATIDAGGWLHTGDIGIMDTRGYLRITDRKKDMFIVGGFNAYPAEIESVLLQHPAIAQAAVVGAPDERLGEVGIAFLVLKNATSLDPEELIAWSRQRMANYKVPRRVVVVDALPMNATGKVLKFRLREQLQSTP
ncbi:MAG TPA: FadD3 family acyl-CoA ligase [Polyangiaceae bacterium]|nr:FadD3 family acyl-CoA ligase [Polyangiaceae bacterium]